MKRHHCTDCEGLDAEDDEDWSVSWFCHAECEVFGRFGGNEECTEKPDEPFQWERMQCVFEGSSLKLDKRHFMSYLFYQVLEFNVIGILHKI